MKDLVTCISSPSIRYISIHHCIDRLHHIHHLVFVNSSTVIQVIPTKIYALSYFKEYKVLHFESPAQLLFCSSRRNQVIGHDELFEV